MRRVCKNGWEITFWLVFGQDVTYLRESLSGGPNTAATI